MISLHNISGAGQALHYFSADNYYSRDEGLEHSEWFGQGAQVLGLRGQIEREAFFALLNGKVAGQELGRLERDEKTGLPQRLHRPGIDVTFSAPKSVSLLAEIAGIREVRQAHEVAVRKTLAYLESELAATRQMRDGALETVKTGNVLVALFRHNSSRDLDPQTHTHALVLNATLRADGHWRSLSNEALYEAQRSLGARYTAELALGLQQLGYVLRRTDDKGNFEVEGISREQIEHFSQRRSEILASLEARGLAPEEASAHDKENATLMTRARKQEVDHASLMADWKQRGQAVGLQLEDIRDRAELHRQQGGLVRTDRLSGKQAMEFAAAHLVEREVVLSKEDLLHTALEHGVGRVAPDAVHRAFYRLEQQGHLVRLPDGRYTTARMLGSEKWALEQVRAHRGQSAPIMAADAVAAQLTRAARRQGLRFTPGQTEAISQVLSSQDRYVGVQGLAGTGKTTMLKALRELAQEQGYVVRGMAPTGAAAKVLARETGIATDTVAMFQIKERQLQKDIGFAQLYAPDFRRKTELWIVDESSLLPQRQMAQLHHLAAGAGARLVYLGDSRQLQAVEAGKPFELAQQKGLQTAYMTEISRQKTADLKAAVDIVTGRDRLADGEPLREVELKHNARAFAHMDRTGMVREVRDGDAVEALVKDLIAMPAAERARTLVITAFNEDRRSINAGVRAGLQRQGELDPQEQLREVLLAKGWTRAQRKEAQYYQQGDVVRFGRDYRQMAAHKGEYARVESVDAQGGRVRLRKEDGSVLVWQPRLHNQVEVYDADTRAIAVGERIRITRNGRAFKNGELARVAAIEGDMATLELQQGKGLSRHTVDLRQQRHWDHAYASTVHAAQGATQYRAIFHIRAPEAGSKQQQEGQLAAMARVFGNRSFYVGTTRASHELRVYTNDKAGAARAIAAQQDKSSAVEVLEQRTHDQGRER